MNNVNASSPSPKDEDDDNDEDDDDDIEDNEIDNKKSSATSEINPERLKAFNVRDAFLKLSSKRLNYLSYHLYIIYLFVQLFIHRNNLLTP